MQKKESYTHRERFCCNNPFDSAICLFKNFVFIFLVFRFPLENPLHSKFEVIVIISNKGKAECIESFYSMEIKKYNKYWGNKSVRSCSSYCRSGREHNGHTYTIWEFRRKMPMIFYNKRKSQSVSFLFCSLFIACSLNEIE